MITLIEPPAIAITFSSSNYNGFDISCNGSCDGEITSIIGDASFGIVVTLDS